MWIDSGRMDRERMRKRMTGIIVTGHGHFPQAFKRRKSGGRKTREGGGG